MAERLQYAAQRQDSPLGPPLWVLRSHALPVARPRAPPVPSMIVWSQAPLQGSQTAVSCKLHEG